MKKKIVILGIILLFAGIILGFLAGAVLPGNLTIPFIYGSNQIAWLFVAVIGFVTGIVALFLKPKEKLKSKEELK